MISRVDIDAFRRPVMISTSKTSNVNNAGYVRDNYHEYELCYLTYKKCPHIDDPNFEDCKLCDEMCKD